MMAKAICVHQGFGLFLEGFPHLRRGEIAVGFHQPAERSYVADDVAGPAVEGLPRNLHCGAIDLHRSTGLRMPVEHDSRAAERVGENAIGTGLGIAALDGQHPLRMRQVPGFAAVSLFESGQHQLRAHGSVAEERARANRVLQA